MQHIGFKTLKDVKSTLLLGVAGGSAIKILRNEIHNKEKITGVEIDSKVIDIATTYFNLGCYHNFEIIIEDARIFIAQNEQKFDFILIDIFEDNAMPDFLFEDPFIENIKLAMTKNSYILFNFMLLNDFENKLHKFIAAFDTNEYKVSTLLNVEAFNNLVIVNKTNE
jgi:spermidine synthase